MGLGVREYIGYSGGFFITRISNRNAEVCGTTEDTSLSRLTTNDNGASTLFWNSSFNDFLQQS
ncbi:MAG TPA: hypothetical protein DDY17_05405 [Syntrophaceae bacterium]|nr:hypothetical protein [Syntrophaceae bacterium]